MADSAHIDTFARDHLPPPDQLPEFIFELPELQFPKNLNCASELLDRHIAEGRGEHACLRAPGGLQWTYADLQRHANRIANVLVHDLGVVPGNRVLLRAANKPMLVACWFAVMKVGAIAVGTMPLLRAKELGQIIEKGQVTHALCDAALRDELIDAALQHPRLAHTLWFGDASVDGLEARMAAQADRFDNVATAADDTCLLAFTSGTTGQPKATMHFHRDVMASCACFPPHVLNATADDVFIGSPPIAFTFGLGGLTLFPMSVGAETVLLEKASPPDLLDAIGTFGATVLLTAPTSYRAMAAGARERKLSAPLGGPLRKCVAAGEALPAATRQLWREATGIEIIDGIGATEMLHIFISADEAHARPGATGKVVPGYRACVMDAHGVEAPRGTVGRLAVKGPTGCRYLDDARQSSYVSGGWNFTGDAYVHDGDGYFHHQSRTDDMIVSSGYNIAAPEVEEVLLTHPSVAECAVIGVPDAERGQIVKAFVVLHDSQAAVDATVRALQDFVKAAVAPYKYPRAIEFRAVLPRTQTGKLQRFKLRQDLQAQSSLLTPPAPLSRPMSDPTLMPTPDAAPDTAHQSAQVTAPMNPAECAQQLKQLFPALFSGAVKPLKLRIQVDIQERKPGTFSKQALSAFFRRHTGSTSYLIAVTKALNRFDLDGQPAGEITDEHRKVAQDELARRRTGQEERRQLDEQQRRNRAGLLHDFQTTTLTKPNFCALKGVPVEELDGLLDIARSEAEERARQAPPLRHAPAFDRPRQPNGDRPRPADGDRSSRGGRGRG